MSELGFLIPEIGGEVESAPAFATEREQIGVVGSGVTAIAIDLLDVPTAVDVAEVSSEYQSALEGCAADSEADFLLAHPKWVEYEELRREYFAEIESLTKSSTVMLDYFQRWSKCMQQSGFSFDTPTDLVKSVADRVQAARSGADVRAELEVVLQYDIKVSLLSFDCMADLGDPTGGERQRVAQEFKDRHEAELLEVAEALKQLVREAEALS